MATATKTYKTSPVKKVKAAEAAWVKGRDAASAAARDYTEQLRLAEGLNDERRRLVHKEPELVTHTGEPTNPKNPLRRSTKS